MREIKFRAWDIDHNCMNENIGIDKIYLYDFKGDNITEQEGLVIMQYTGLKDKNGKEIYEGDIIRNVSGQRKYIVTWDEKEAYFYGEMIGVKDSNFIDWKNFEIIGNIYESPKEVTP